MRRFSGTGGNVYDVGEPLAFREVPLQDCGEGWDWRAPEGLRYWLEDDLRFEVFDREWWEIGAVEVHHRSGRVGFERCVAGMAVRATGICRPTSLIATGSTWQLDVEAVVGSTASLGHEVATVGIRTLSMAVAIEGISIGQPIDEVLIRLPLSGDGSFVGIGTLRPGEDRAVVHFNEEGACYAIA
jgi:hypothetical protein